MKPKTSLRSMNSRKRLMKSIRPASHFKATQILVEFRNLENKVKAKILSRFFKTGKGEYGEGDKFLGITVPVIRKIAKKYRSLSFEELSKLIKSSFHEVRLLALLIIIEKLDDGDGVKKKVFDFYFKNIKYINNWDLIDVTCRFIVGDYLFDRDRGILYDLAKSENLWERRIAIVSTYSFIRCGQYVDTLNISKILIFDRHDLIHKAVGWMLREVGKRDEKLLKQFLSKYSAQMPRTMLRYAIERLSVNDRKMFMTR